MNDKEKLKKIIVIGIVIILLIVIIVIFIPKKNSKSDNNNELDNIQNNDEEYVSNNDLVIDNIDFGKLFFDAEKLYASFTGFGTFKTSNKSNDKYYLVTDTNYDTLEKVKNELNKYFISNIVNSLLETKVENDLLYKEIDGKLYRFGGYAGQYGYTNRENNLSVRKISDEKFILHDRIVFGADTSMEKEGTYEHDYAIQKEGDNYKFVNFELPVTFYGEIVKEKS